MPFRSSFRRRRQRPRSPIRIGRRATTNGSITMGRRFAQFGPLIALLMAFLAQTVSAQNGERMREWRARQEARREAAARNRANGGGAAKGQPNERAMEVLPPKWVDRVRDMPPEQQQQFFENNAQFRQLPPARQEQI